MDPPATSQSLPLAELRRIEEICSSFEEAGDFSVTAIEAALDGWAGAGRKHLLRELVWLSLEIQNRDPAEAGEWIESFASDVDRQLARQAVHDAATKAKDSSDVLDTVVIGSERPESTRYSFQSQIGSGGLGVIFRVFDHYSERTLAIKCLRGELRNDELAVGRLVREAILTGRLQHPSIPPIYDFGRLDSGQPYFSMKLIEGETFAEILRRRESAEQDQAKCLDIFEHVAQSIAYAHSQSVVHRDLKPQNVMVGAFGEVQVLDWGLAASSDESVSAEEQTKSTLTDFDEALLRAGPDSQVDSTLTTDGDIVGTPNFMSPEQARGDTSAIDCRSDVFGLGAILFQILTNTRLFEGDSPSQALSQSAAGDLGQAYAKLQTIDGRSELVQLCKECLQVDPDLRPRDASEVAERLHEYQSGLREQLQQAKVETVRQTERVRRQRLLTRLLSAVGAIAIVGLLAVLYQRNLTIGAQAAELAAEQQARTQLETTNDVADFLVKILRSARPSAAGEGARVIDVMDALEPEIAERFAERHRVRGMIRREFGVTYRWLGDPAAAMHQLRLAIAAFEQSDPFDELGLLDAEDKLAGVLRSEENEQNLKEAETLRRHVLERRTELLGEQDFLTVKAKNNLGTVLESQGRYPEARKLYEEALAATAADPTIAPLELVTSRLNLHQIQAREKDFDSAIAGMHLLIAENADSIERAEVLVQLQNSLGQICLSAGRQAEARAAFETSLAEHTAFYGKDHPSTLSVQRKLCRLLVDMQQYEEAIELLRDCIARSNEVFGPAAGLTFSIRCYLPRALEGRGDIEAARREWEAIIRRQAEDRGEDHKYTLEARESYAEFKSRVK